MPAASVTQAVTQAATQAAATTQLHSSSLSGREREQIIDINGHFSDRLQHLQ
jgi:hypothetical protein